MSGNRGDEDIQKAIRGGERNKEVRELVYNWCRHARVERSHGPGMVEMETGLPIGHHYMACNHAPAGGFASWDLAESALFFYDHNCKTCAHRAPVRFPNLSSLVGKREAYQQRVEEAKQTHEGRLTAARAERTEKRRALRASLGTVSATVVDNLEELDQGKKAASAELIGLAQLAPEAFVPSLVEHCFETLEAREAWFDDTGLQVLHQLQVDAKRLARCAMLSLGEHRSWQVAASVVTPRAKEIDPTLLTAALPVLIDLANPEREIFLGGERTLQPGPLLAVYRAHPAATQASIIQLLDQRDPYLVSAGARAVQVLAEDHPAVASACARSLAAKLARAHLLLDRRETGYLGDDEAIGRLQGALALALEYDPVPVDRLIDDFIQAAPVDGEARLYEVYSDVLHGRRRHGKSHAAPTVAARVAIKRLTSAATISPHEKVLQEIKQAFSYVDKKIEPIVRDELTAVMGAVLLIDYRIQRFDDEPKQKRNFWETIERQNTRTLYVGLRDSLLECAANAAAGEAGATAQYIAMLSQIPEERDRVRASMIEHAEKLMDTPDGLNAMLPSFYSGMCGSSTRVRAATATVLGKLNRRRVADLPELMLDAFLALLSDSFVMVHRAAVDTLSRITLPDKFVNRARVSLWGWIPTYAADSSIKDDRFLLKCIELFLRRYASDAEKRGPLGVYCVSLLDKMQSDVLDDELGQLHHDLGETDGFAKVLLRVLADESTSQYQLESLLDTVHKLPASTILANKAELEKIALAQQAQVYVPGGLVETLTTAGTWEEAARINTALYDNVPGSIERHAQKLSTNLWRVAALYEKAIAEGNLDALPELAQAWRKTEADIEADRKDNASRRNPFSHLLRPH